MDTRALVRILVVASLVAAGLVVSTGPAAADFHLMKVDEVFAGTTTQPNADFVELRMTAADQGNVSGHGLILYDAFGTAMRCDLPADVVNEASGAPILLGTTEYDAVMDPSPDFTIPPLLHADGGAVCWESIDCAAWGTFSGTTTTPAGTPESGGIPPGTSIQRVADTNNSDADFIDQPSPMPEPNGAATVGTTTCQPLTGTGGAGGAASLMGLRARVKGGRAFISGRIEPPVPGQRVKLTFFANGSPLRKVAAKNATLNASSRFRKSFRVPADSTRCRVRVAFGGQPMGKKTFRC
jgi:hypothetical protein